MIKIAARFHPYSHLPGATCLLPQSFWQVKAFPALLSFKNIESGVKVEIQMQIEGPVKEFTLEQDLERGEVHLFGNSVKGYFRFSICKREAGIEIRSLRVPQEGVLFTIQETGVKQKLMRGDLFLLKTDDKHLITAPFAERLSLGMHKAQDWDLIRRRQKLEEIAPLWLRLAGSLPEIKDQIKDRSGLEGTLALLEETKEILNSGKKEKIIPSLQKAFLTGFSGILVPRLWDDEHQGILPASSKKASDLSPLVFLKRGAALIRSLFFEEGESSVSLLPHLPPEFSAGRFVSIKRSSGDVIDIEWSKKLLNRAIIRSAEDQELSIHLQKALKRFRLRHSERGKGVWVQNGEKIQLRAGERIFLDRFEK